MKLTYMAGHDMIKLWLKDDNSLWTWDMKIEQWIPHTVSRKGIQKAKTIFKGKEKAIKQAEQELLEDEEWLKNHTKEEIKKEIKKEMAKRGFRLVREK